MPPNFQLRIFVMALFMCFITCTALASDAVRVLVPKQWEESLSDLSAAHPNLEIVTYASPGEMASRIGECDGIIGEPDESVVRASPRLRWIQARFAGMESLMWLRQFEDRGLVLTNAKILMGPQLADHAFALLLSLTRNMRFYGDAMRDGTWDRSGGLKLLELRDKTMLVIGLGGAGMQIAERANAFGMRVIAIDRHDLPLMEGIAKLGRPDEILAFLPEADVVVSAVPLTEESQNLLDADAIAVMKQGAIVINISRGRVINTDALTEALRSGKLGGAGLDVTEPEPLPADHALWKMPNVIISPHIAGFSDGRDPRTLELVRDNIGRFARGLALKNVVDLSAGY